MRSELIVDVQPTDISTALLEDGRLMSLQKESRDVSYAVGNLYFAKVKKLMPGLNAAFVNVGHKKDAFLHYLDLGSQFGSYSEFIKSVLENPEKRPSLSKFKLKPDIDKHGSVSDVLQQGQQLLVQIVKEPISTKGPRLTTEITFTGRFMVLIPFNNKISVSQKIKNSAEKMRLRKLVESIKPHNFGVIIRTSAENKRAAELNAEMKVLVKCWEDSVAKLQYTTPPALVYEEESRAVSVIRDIFSPEFESIYVNNAEIYDQLHNYVSLIAPDRADIVTAETCPSCGGKGEVLPSLLFTDMLKDKIDYLVNSLGVKNFIMYVHPFVEAYLKKGVISEYFKWRREFGRKFKLMADQSLAYLQYKVIDKDHNEIDLKEEKDTSSSHSKKEQRSRNTKNED